MQFQPATDPKCNNSKCLKRFECTRYMQLLEDTTSNATVLGDKKCEKFRQIDPKYRIRSKIE